MRLSNERGVALIATMLLLAMMGALLVGFMALVTADQRSSRATRDQTQAYAAAHAGLEKLTSDLGDLFATNYAPSCTAINGLVASTRLPTLPNVSFEAPGGGSGYSINYTCVSNRPQSESTPRTITAGPYQGFQGLVTPYDILVTARTDSGAEVRMRRQMQTVAIPVFQFGIFSENDLSFFAGPNFNFGGRVHTNSNLFLAEGNGNTLTLADRVTVFGEVVRRNLSNGWLTQGNNYDGTVRVATSATQTTVMGFDKGSWGAAMPQLPGPPTGEWLEPWNDPAWTTFSVSTTHGYMRNGRTGARRLELPLVQMGARPIDLVRRPRTGSNEDTANAAVFGQRYYSMASLRVLLSDRPEDLTDLPGVTATAPVNLADLTASGYVVDGDHPPVAKVPAAVYSPAAQNYLASAGSALVTGYLKIEVQRSAGVWEDVTLDILNRGIAGRNLSTGVLNTPGTGCAEPNTNAIIRLQRLRDNPDLRNPGAGTPAAPAEAKGSSPCGNGSQRAGDYWPNVLYDAREGLARDNSSLLTERRHFLGGLMHYIELDVRNLSLWMAAQGPNIMSDTGYVLYFSDRRGNWHDPADDNRETGEYGFEDVVNPTLTNGFPGNGLYSNPPARDSGSTPDEGEDFNGDGALQTYGAVPVQTFTAPLDGAARPWTALNWNYSGAGSVYDGTKPIAGRVNPPVFFRRALKLVNGGLGNIIAPGLTITSENPVYVQGNYNASSAGFGNNDNHRACAIIADAVTLLSNEWNDINSFLSAHDPAGGHPGSGPTSPGRRATGNAWYRVAVVSGKGLSFRRPSSFTTYQDFGTDGGAHNFLRYIEEWSSSLNYRGSIVSFFTSRQAVGTYKCCENVYGPPTRGYNFDTDFLTPALLPPRTPMFRDVNILTFRQILRPTQ